MSSRVALITDSTCSLPASLIKKYQIIQTPIEITIDGKTFLDPCNSGQSLKLFSSGGLSKKHEVTTAPPTIDQFEASIDQAVQRGAQVILVQTINRNQGDTYNNANVAVSNYRRKLDKDSKVIIRAMDSRTVTAGQALMAVETLRKIGSGQDSNEVKRYMDNFSSNIHTFALPKEPLLAFERARKRNEKAVGWTQVFVADTLGIHPIMCIVNDSSYLAAKAFGYKKAAKQLFNHIGNRIEKGLLSPYVTINYAGDLNDLELLEGYAQLQFLAESRKVKIIPSVMSIAGGIYTSVGAISIAIATQEHEWEG